MVWPSAEELPGHWPEPMAEHQMRRYGQPRELGCTQCTWETVGVEPEFTPPHSHLRVGSRGSSISLDSDHTPLWLYTINMIRLQGHHHVYHLLTLRWTKLFFLTPVTHERSHSSSAMSCEALSAAAIHLPNPALSLRKQGLIIFSPRIIRSEP